MNDDENDKLRRDLAMAGLELEEARQSARADAARLAAQREETAELRKTIVQLSDKLERADRELTVARAERDSLAEELRTVRWESVLPAPPPTDEVTALRAELDRLTGGELFLSCEAAEPTRPPRINETESISFDCGHESQIKAANEFVVKLRAELAFKSAMVEEFRQRAAKLKAEALTAAQSLETIRRGQILVELQTNGQRRLQALSCLESFARRLKNAYNNCLALLGEHNRTALADLEKQLNECIAELKDLEELLFNS